MEIVVLLPVFIAGSLCGFYLRDRISRNRFTSIKRDVAPVVSKVLYRTRDVIKHLSVYFHDVMRSLSK
jgi:hypothetical protein